jgi:hypothetical protein
MMQKNILSRHSVGRNGWVAHTELYGLLPSNHISLTSKSQFSAGVIILETALLCRAIIMYYVGAIISAGITLVQATSLFRRYCYVDDIVLLEPLFCRNYCSA